LGECWGGGAHPGRQRSQGTEEQRKGEDSNMRMCVCPYAGWSSVRCTAPACCHGRRSVSSTAGNWYGPVSLECSPGVATVHAIPSAQWVDHRQDQAQEDPSSPHSTCHPTSWCHVLWCREVVNLRNEGRWVFLNTLFSVSEGVMYMQLVDRLDLVGGERGWGCPFGDAGNSSTVEPGGDSPQLHD
jgi:hypothetical protein